MTDPFASAPAEAQDTIVAEAPVSAPSIPTTTAVVDGEVVVTLKGGSGFDAPWIVVHAPNAASALGQLDGTMLELMEKAQNAAKHFTGLGPAKAGGSAPASPGAAPAGAQGPPPGAPPAPGADWTFKSGVSASTGKPWKGWMPPRGSTEKPLFFN